MMKNDTAIRTAQENEFLDIAEFVSGCPPLEPYPEHMFRIMLRFFRDTFLVADTGGRVTGVCWGFFSQSSPETFFIWQIGVGPSLQGKGIGRKLLAELENIVRSKGAERIELTIAPENTPSQKLFEKTGYSNISTDFPETVTIGPNPAVKDHYRPGAHYMVYSKTL